MIDEKTVERRIPIGANTQAKLQQLAAQMHQIRLQINNTLEIYAEANGVKADQEFTTDPEMKTLIVLKKKPVINGERVNGLAEKAADAAKN